MGESSSHDSSLILFPGTVEADDGIPIWSPTVMVRSCEDIVSRQGYRGSLGKKFPSSEEPSIDIVDNQDVA
jgi:hypothetical protein